LRNNGAGYGMNALKVFNILYGLKKIEENGLIDKCNLSDKCKFSYLLKLANAYEANKQSKEAIDTYSILVEKYGQSAESIPAKKYKAILESSISE
jgi:hypothetical protein